MPGKIKKYVTMPTSILVLWFLSGAAAGAIVVREIYTWQKAGFIQRTAYRLFSFFWTIILLSAAFWCIYTNENSGGITFMLKIQPQNEAKNVDSNPERATGETKSAKPEKAGDVYPAGDR